MLSRTRGFVALIAGVSLLNIVVPADDSTSALPPPPGDDTTAEPLTSRYEALTPCRLADTRTRTGFIVIDDQHSRVALDRCGIPADAVAIVTTTTIIQAQSNGWLVAYPAGASRPDAATLNWSAGMTRGNAATIAVGNEHSIDLFVSGGSASGHVAIDVVGAFVPAASATAGRFVSAPEAQRLVDTRSPSIAQPLSGSTWRVPLPASVPVGSDAVSINLTVVNTRGPSFLTPYPAGESRPLASALNADGTGQFRSAATIVPVTDDGFDVYVDGATDIVVDLTGWFTGDEADESTDGLFVPIAPVRLRDTRSEPQPLYTGGTTEIVLPAGLTSSVQDGPPAAIATSMTLIGADERGFVTTHAARTSRPETASGYSLRNETTAQFGITPASESGLAVYSERGTDLTIDLLGWFTGPPAEQTRDSPAANPQRQLKVLAVGDSTMAGVRWYRALGALTGASWTFAGESCRRLVRFSCRGREGRHPPTTVRTIEAYPDVFDVLVVMTGYNDRASTFEADLAGVMAAARAKNIRKVVWLTYAREFRTDKGGPGAFQVYEFQNVLLRAAADRYPELVVADWARVARERPEWVHYDGIHFTDDGSYGNADFMSRAVAHATGQPCPVPYGTGVDESGVCPDPGTVASPNVRNIYGFRDTVLQCWEVGPSRTPECVQDPYTF